jgi:DtxR family Mn-dependent transcriptional regulator
MPERIPSKAEEDYLKAIHHLGGTERLVLPNEIASRLQVRSPSVTGMLKQLAEAGWIVYEVGRGARLTPQGLREARRVVRRHRLVELFLHRVLGLDWSEVDAEAERLEHVISPRLERAIAAYLGEPMEDPHGHLIPTPEGEIASRELCPIVDLQEGERGIVREVRDDDPQRLRQWEKHGLKPGARVKMVARHTLDDVFELEVNDRLVRVGSEGLAGIFAEKIEG